VALPGELPKGDHADGNLHRREADASPQ